jgi:hypothetical protein
MHIKDPDVVIFVCIEKLEKLKLDKIRNEILRHSYEFHRDVVKNQRFLKVIDDTKRNQNRAKCVLWDRDRLKYFLFTSKKLFTSPHTLNAKR